MWACHEDDGAFFGDIESAPGTNFAEEEVGHDAPEGDHHIVRQRIRVHRRLARKARRGRGIFGEWGIANPRRTRRTELACVDSISPSELVPVPVGCSDNQTETAFLILVLGVVGCFVSTSKELGFKVRLQEAS